MVPEPRSLLLLRRLQHAANRKERRGLPGIFLHDVFKKHNDDPVVVHERWCRAKALPVAHVPRGIKDHTVLQHHVRASVHDAHGHELLAGLFHVADADTVGTGWPGRNWMSLPVGALKARRAGLHLAKVVLEPAMVHEAVIHE